MLLYNHGKIPRPQLGLALGKSADGSNAGQLAFGGIAPSKFQGDMAVMESVSNEGYWEVPISINSGSASIESRTGIVDTRSAVIWAPQEDVIKIFTSVDGACS